MLKHLQLQNFAIADFIDLDFDHGFTAITGETGAGKSILINALKLALGERAQSDFVKNGEKRASICANFNIDELQTAQQWLINNEFDEEGDCIIRRVLTHDGRSKAYINGHACTLSELKSLGKQLISIHGQHEGQQLLQVATQQILLDAFGNNLVLSKKTQSLYQSWKKTLAEHEALLKQTQDAAKQAEFLRFQIEELEALELTPEKISQLDEEQKQLANADQVLLNNQQIYDLLQGDDSVTHKLSLCIQQLESLPLTHKKDLLDTLNQANIQSEEVARELKIISDNLELNPQRLHEVEALLTQIHDISRKHRVKPEQLPPLLSQFQQELNQIENSDQQLIKLEKDITRLKNGYDLSAQKLSSARKKAAKRLSQEITRLIQTLGMPKAYFDVNLSPVTASAYGLEKVEFMVQLNPGHPFSSLAKVASGGELSRISLAIHVATAQYEQTATLIFDEVDSGISGEVATIVALLLKKLAQSTQIISITHLAQVAAKASQHLHVAKSSKQGHTHSRITTLCHEQRINELAKMASGKTNDSSAIALAESLLSETE